MKLTIFFKAGGGDNTDSRYRHSNTEYTLYMRYDKTGLTQFPDTLRFVDDNLSGEQLEKIFLGIYNMRNLGGLIESGKGELKI